MFEAAYLGASIFAVAVADDDFGDFQIQFCSAKNQVEIAKGIKIAEIRPVFYQFIPIDPGYRLCSTQGVFDPLSQQP